MSNANIYWVFEIEEKRYVIRVVKNDIPVIELMSDKIWKASTKNLSFVEADGQEAIKGIFYHPREVIFK